MTYHKCLAEVQDDEAILLDRERRIAEMEKFAPMGLNDPAWAAYRTALEKLNDAETESQCETAFARLFRVMRHERLVAGLKEMVLCRPKYGDAACEEIRRLLEEN